MKKTVFKFASAAAILACLFTILYHQREQLQHYPWREHFRPGLFSLSLLVLVIHFLCRVALWKQLIVIQKDRITLKDSFRVSVYSSLTKYLPGKLWVPASKVYLTQKTGVRHQTAISAVLWESGLIIASSALAAFLCPAAHNTLMPFVSVLTGVFILLAAFPDLPTRLANIALSKLNRQTVIVPLSRQTQIAMLALYIGSWAILGLAFHLFISSIHPVPVSRYPAALGAFSFAWLAGFLSFFAPSGLGVREGLLVLLLARWLPLEIATMTALGARVWLMLAELTCFMAALALNAIPKPVRKRR